MNVNYEYIYEFEEFVCVRACAHVHVALMVDYIEISKKPCSARSDEGYVHSKNIGHIYTTDNSKAAGVSETRDAEGCADFFSCLNHTSIPIYLNRSNIKL